MWGKQRVYLRLTALITAIVFSCPMPGWAQAVTPRTGESVSSAVSKLSFDQITLPEELGSIEGMHRGKSSKTVVLIQDAHAIPDAQRSIQKLIEYFQEQYGVNLVALEGASSALDPQIFRSFPDQRLLTKVFEQYMQDGELAGGPAAAIFSDRDASYYGIEDWDLYEQGIRYYLKAMAVEDSVMDKINALKTNLKDQKEKAYSKELFQLDQSLEEFYENHVNLPEILKQLGEIKAPQANSELAVLLEETRRQKDEDSLSTEVSRLAENIHQYLKKNAFSKEARDLLMEFNQKHQEFSTSRLAPQAFALYLKKVAADHQLPVRVSKALHTRTQKQQKLENIKGTRLFDDFEHYANEVKGSLLKSERAKKLNGLGERLRLIETFARLELSHDQWNEIKQLTGDNKQYIRNGVYLGNAEVSKDEMEILQMLDPHFKFYQAAHERDEKFLNNLRSLMQKEDTEQLVMVSGGFHARNMARILEDSGFSYLLLMPKINSIPDDVPYRQQMQGEVSWKEYFEVENGKINLYKAFVRAARDRLLKESDSGLTKAWRDQIIRDLAEQNRITESGRYTVYIDEVSGREIKTYETGSKVIAEAIKFADGLRKLHSSGKLSQDNILQLLRPATTEPLVGAAVTSLDPTAIASADLVRPGVSQRQRLEIRTTARERRSEVRVDPVQALKDTGFFDETLNNASGQGFEKAIRAISALGSEESEITPPTIQRIIEEHLNELGANPIEGIQIIAGLAISKNDPETRASIQPGVYTDWGLATAFRTWAIFQRGGAGDLTNAQLIALAKSYQSETNRSEVRSIEGVHQWQALPGYEIRVEMTARDQMRVRIQSPSTHFGGRIDETYEVNAYQFSRGITPTSYIAQALQTLNVSAQIDSVPLISGLIRMATGSEKFDRNFQAFYLIFDDLFGVQSTPVSRPTEQRAGTPPARTAVDRTVQRIIQSERSTDYGYPFQDDPVQREALIEGIHREVGDEVFRDALVKMIEDNYGARRAGEPSIIMGILNNVHLIPLLKNRPELLDDKTKVVFLAKWLESFDLDFFNAGEAIFDRLPGNLGAEIKSLWETFKADNPLAGEIPSYNMADGATTVKRVPTGEQTKSFVNLVIQKYPQLEGRVRSELRIAQDNPADRLAQVLVDRIQPNVLSRFADMHVAIQQAVDSQLENPEMDTVTSILYNMTNMFARHNGITFEKIPSQEYADFIYNVGVALVNRGIRSEMRLESISGRPLRAHPEKPLVVFSDAHSTLLYEAWLKEAEVAYQRIQAAHGNPGVTDLAAAEWVQSNVLFTSREDVVSKLKASVPGGTDQEARGYLSEAKTAVENPQNSGVLLKPIPGALEFLQGLKASGVPIVIMSGESRESIVNQLRATGLIQFLDEKMIFGRGEMTQMMPSGQPYDRDLALETIYRNNFDGSEAVHFNDWRGGQAGVRKIGGINVGLLQGGAQAKDRFREVLTNEVKVDFILDGGYPTDFIQQLLPKRSETRTTPEKLQELTQQLKDELKKPEASRSLTLISQLTAQRKSLTLQYISERLGEKVRDGRVTGNNEIVVALEGYINSDVYSGMQPLLLEGEFTDRTIAFFQRISEVGSQTLAEGLDTGDVERQIRGSREDVEGLTPSLKANSRFYSEEEVTAYKDWNNYMKPQMDWAARRGKDKAGKVTDSRWQKPLKSDGTLDHKTEEENAKSVLEGAKSLMGLLNEIINAVIQESNLGNSVLTVQSRVKELESTLNKLKALRARGIDASLGGMTDLLGARIIVEDLQSLEKIMMAVEGFIQTHQNDPRFGGMQILRKENKFIANDGKDDPYRAIQYTITMPGKNGELYTFELQLNDFYSALVAEFTEQVNYKTIIQLPGELREMVKAVHWRQTTENYKNYLTAKGRKVPVSQLSLEQQIQIAIEARDFNAFYDLVLSKITPETFASKAKWIQMYDWVNAMLKKEVEFLEELRQTRPEVVEALIAATHDKGYWEAKDDKGISMKDRVDNPADASWIVPELPQSAYELLPPEGKKAYDNRYENFNGSNNKLTVGMLGLHRLSADDLEKFFSAVGKDVKAEGVIALMAEISNLRGKSDQEIMADANLKKVFKRAVLNLYHMPFAAMKQKAAQIKDAKAKQIFLDTIRINNIKAAALTAMLTEIGGVDAQGNPRDLNRFVPGVADENGVRYTIKEKLTHEGWAFAVQSGGEYAYDGTDRKGRSDPEGWRGANDLTQQGYPDFINTKKHAWARALDKSIDDANMKELTTQQLLQIAQIIRGTVSPVRLQRLQRAKSLLMGKYLKSLVRDRSLAEQLTTAIDQRYNRDSDILLRGNGGAAELQSSIVTNAQKTDRGMDFMGAKAFPNGILETAELLNSLIANSDLNDADIQTLRGVLSRSESRGVEEAQAILDVDTVLELENAKIALSRSELRPKTQAELDEQVATAVEAINRGEEPTNASKYIKIAPTGILLADASHAQPRYWPGSVLKTYVVEENGNLKDETWGSPEVKEGTVILSNGPVKYHGSHPLAGQEVRGRYNPDGTFTIDQANGPDILQNEYLTDVEFVTNPANYGITPTTSWQQRSKTVPNYVIQIDPEAEGDFVVTTKSGTKINITGGDYVVINTKKGKADGQQGVQAAQFNATYVDYAGYMASLKRSEVRNDVELVYVKPGYYNDGDGSLTITINKGEPVRIRLTSQYFGAEDLDNIKGLLGKAENPDEINRIIEKIMLNIGRALVDLEGYVQKLRSETRTVPEVSEALKHRPGYSGSIYQIPEAGTDRVGQEGKATLRIFEIFNLVLTPSEEAEVIRQIQQNPNKHILLLKKDVVERAKPGKVDIVLTKDMGIIPSGIVGKKVTIGDNAPAILEDAVSNNPDDVTNVAQVRLSPAGLFRVKVGDYYLLSLNKNRLKKGKYVATPIGGAYDFTSEQGKAIYEQQGIVMTPDDEKKPLEMRQTINGNQVPAFLDLFNQGQGRETSAIRELQEELVGEGSEEDVFRSLPQNARLMTYLSFDQFPSETEVYQDFRQVVEKKAKASGVSIDFGMLDRAFELASQYHREIRDDGRVYILHPLEIAHFLVSGLDNVDQNTLLAAMLHDLPEDTPVTFEQIRTEFGEEVETVVRDLTENTEYRQNTDLVYQSTDGQEYSGRLATKIEHLDRVEAGNRPSSIVLKVVDRLHNLLTNESPKNVKQRRMELPEIERWFKFLEHPVIPETLKDQIIPLLNREKQIIEASRSEVRRLAGFDASYPGMRTLAKAAATVFADFVAGELKIDDARLEDFSIGVYKGANENIDEFLYYFMQSIDQLNAAADQQRLNDIKTIFRDLANFLRTKYKDQGGAFILAGGNTDASERAAAYQEALSRAAPFIQRLYVERSKDGDGNVAIAGAITDSGVSVRPEFITSATKTSKVLYEFLPVLRMDKIEDVKEVIGDRSDLLPFGIDTEGYKENNVTQYEKGLAVFVQFVLGYIALQELEADDVALLIDKMKMAGREIKEIKDKALQAKIDQVFFTLKEQFPDLENAINRFKNGSPNILLSQIQNFVTQYRSEARIKAAA